MTDHPTPSAPGRTISLATARLVERARQEAADIAKGGPLWNGETEDLLLELAATIEAMNARPVALTRLRRAVLKDFAAIPAEPHGGWAYAGELGVPTHAVGWLHQAGLLERDGDKNGQAVDYRISEAGRAALSEATSHE